MASPELDQPVAMSCVTEISRALSVAKIRVVLETLVPFHPANDAAFKAVPTINYTMCGRNGQIRRRKLVCLPHTYQGESTMITNLQTRLKDWSIDR